MIRIFIDTHYIECRTSDWVWKSATTAAEGAVCLNLNKASSGRDLQKQDRLNDWSLMYDQAIYHIQKVKKIGVNLGLKSDLSIYSTDAVN